MLTDAAEVWGLENDGQSSDICCEEVFHRSLALIKLWWVQGNVEKPLQSKCLNFGHYSLGPKLQKRI